MPTLSRYRELTRLLVKYGRSDLISGAGLDEFRTADGSDTADAVSERRAGDLADDLERLGPTFIKLGQLLSTRHDLLAPAYTDALQRLQDDVEPFDVSQAREIIEAELGVKISSAFGSFDDTPLAAASLGQVHRATLRDGREVVIKVQRPDVRETVRDDMAVLGRLAAVADRTVEAGRTYGFGGLLSQFRRSLSDELDYRREADNLRTIGALLKPYEHLVVPRPIADFCTSRVLTMEFIRGRKVTDVTGVALLEVDARPLVEDLFRAYLQMILDHGVLHADPHPGNLLLTDDGRLALLDLGMVAHVPKRVQSQMVKLLLALGDADGDEAALILAGMGHPLEDHDSAAFRAEVTYLVSSAMAQGADLEVGTVMMELSRLSGEHGLRPPPEMAMIGKALLNLDQATMHLDPGFVPAEAIQRNVADIMRSGLTVSMGGVVSSAIEAKEFAAALPRRANRILDALSQGELELKINAFDEDRALTVVQRLANRIVMGIVLAAIVVGAALMARVPTAATLWGYPAIATIFFVLAAVGGGILVTSIWVKDRRTASRAKETEKRRRRGEQV